MVGFLLNSCETTMSNACLEGGVNMQYENPMIKIVEAVFEDIVCISDGGYDDDDGGFA